MRAGIRAWVTSRIKRLERRWIHDPVERARHDAVVIRRLEQLTGNDRRPDPVPSPTTELTLAVS